jgi:hypothetical protein
MTLPEAVAQNPLIVERRASLLYRIGGYNIPLRYFLASYQSADPKEQNLAYAFLLGVTDATEGRTWCSPDGYKPDTVLESFDEGLTKFKSTNNNEERAAYVITDILKKKYPCRRTAVRANSSILIDSAQENKKMATQKSIFGGDEQASEYIKNQGKAIFTPNLPLQDFLISYKLGKSLFGFREEELDETERDVTRYFFLFTRYFFYGILDATENREWCSYKWYKDITIYEILQDELEKIPAHSRDNERAAYVIADIFKENSADTPPCKKRRY